MAKRPKRPGFMTVPEHEALAADVRELSALVSKAQDIVCRAYGTSSRAAKKAERLSASALRFACAMDGRMWRDHGDAVDAAIYLRVKDPAP